MEERYLGTDGWYLLVRARADDVGAGRSTNGWYWLRMEGVGADMGRGFSHSLAWATEVWF